MGEMIVYSIVSSVVLASMYLVYKFVMAGENQLGYNRAILWVIYIVALSAPMVAGKLTGLIMDVDGGMYNAFFEIEAPTAIGATGAEAAGSALPEIVRAVYLTGLLIVGLMSVFTAVRLAKLIKTGQRYDYGQATVVVHENPGIAPFSWRNYVVMSRADFEESGDMILIHESCHVASRHWIDLLVAQAVIVFQWYNPAAWFMREELKAIHEYQADAAVIASGSDIKQYQMLLIKKAVGGRFQSLANSLNHSNLKKRITMMYKSKSSLGRRFRALALAPAALVAVAVVNIPAVASALNSVSRTQDDDKVTKKVYYGTYEPVLEAAEVNPVFPGGEEALLKYLADNVTYPKKAFEDKIQGRVVVKFVVNSKGQVVVPPEIVRSVSPELDEEAIRVVSTLPDFTPGTVDGRPVSVFYTLPISFKLKE